MLRYRHYCVRAVFSAPGLPVNIGTIDVMVFGYLHDVVELFRGQRPESGKKSNGGCDQRRAQSNHTLTANFV